MKKIVLATFIGSIVAFTASLSYAVTCATLGSLSASTSLSPKDAAVVEKCIHDGYDPPVSWRPRAGRDAAVGSGGGPITPMFRCPPDGACPTSDRLGKGNKTDPTGGIDIGDGGVQIPPGGGDGGTNPPGGGGGGGTNPPGGGGDGGTNPPGGGGGGGTNPPGGGGGGGTNPPGGGGGGGTNPPGGGGGGINPPGGSPPPTFPKTYLDLFPDDTAPPLSCDLSAVGDKNECATSVKPYNCMRNHSPAGCLVDGSLKCDADGYTTSDRSLLSFRDYGYSNDLVADSLRDMGFISENNAKGAPWRVLRERLPKAWYGGPDDSDVKFIMDGLINLGSATPDIRNGQSVAVIVNCRYFRGHAGMVTLYDKLNQCVYVKARNWLKYSCDNFNTENCFQNSSAIDDKQPKRFVEMIPQESDCIPIANVSFMWNYAGPGSGVTPRLSGTQVNVNTAAAACEVGDKGNCQYLCDAGYETFCARGK